MEVYYFISYANVVLHVNFKRYTASNFVFFLEKKRGKKNLKFCGGGGKVWKLLQGKQT